MPAQIKQTSSRRMVQALLTLAVAWTAGASSGQEQLLVTGMLGDGKASWTPTGGETIAILPGEILIEGVLTLPAGVEVMLLGPGENVVIVAGPARLLLGEGEAGEIRIESGRVALYSPDARDAELCLLSLSERATILPAPGWVLVVWNGTEGGVGFSTEAADSGAALRVQIGADEVVVPPGKRLVLTPDRRDVLDLGGWAGENGLDVGRMGVRIAIGAARLAREEVQRRLFQEIISVDRFASSSRVIESVEVKTFRPEVRTVATTLRTSNLTPVAFSSAITDLAFPTANQVPVISPAALSVANLVPGGVFTLNDRARFLLERTGSRGLGFRGPAQLAIPGVGASGAPTIGPAGLGAVR